MVYHYIKYAPLAWQLYQHEPIRRRVNYHLKKYISNVASTAATLYGGTRKRKIPMAPTSKSPAKKRSQSARGRSATRGLPTPARSHSRGARTVSMASRTRTSGIFGRSRSRSTVGFAGAEHGVASGGQGSVARTHKVKKGRIHALAKYGVTYVNEDGAEVTTSVSAPCLGHASIAQEIMQNLFWTAVVKAVLKKMKMQVADLETNLEGFNAADTFEVQFSAFEGDSTSLETYVLGTDNTVLDFVAWFMNAGRTWNLPMYNASCVFQSIRFNPSLSGDAGFLRVSPCTFTMMHAKFQYAVTSEMKIQNRSVPSIAAAGVADQVDRDLITRIDNIPLYMVSYSGTGNGAFRKLKPHGGAPDANTTYVADQTGLISNTVVVPGEPPRPEEFAIKRTSKEIIAPGEIKTSRIASHGTIDVNKFFTKLGINPVNTTVTPADDTRFTLLGDYKFFMFDKMIETLRRTDANHIPIDLVYEINRTHMGMVKEGYSMVTTASFYQNGRLNGAAP